jgi:hypothetical protein
VLKQEKTGQDNKSGTEGRGCVGYFTERHIADENSANEFQIDKRGEMQ